MMRHAPTLHLLSAAAAGGGGGGGGSTVQIVIAQETQPVGTEGGTFTSGAYRTRTLNTLARNDGALASLSSNQVTLPAGTYMVLAFAPACQVTRHKLRLYDATNAAVLVMGQSHQSYSSVIVSLSAVLAGTFTLEAEAAVELQHYCSNTFATYGFGRAVSGSWGDEVYSVVNFVKVA